jgi:choline transport protein
MPLNATWTATIFCILYGLIYIGSTTAFNSFISMAILALNVSYILPQGILLYRGRQGVLPERHFKLRGVLGPFVNAFSCLWIALFLVIFCFPVFNPPTPANMNYVSVVVVAIGVFVTAMWFGGKRKTFVGPVSPKPILLVALLIRARRSYRVLPRPFRCPVSKNQRYKPSRCLPPRATKENLEPENH